MTKQITKGAVVAWLLVAIYYFYQYALRSAPSVMMPQLTEAFAVDALGVSALYCTIFTHNVTELPIHTVILSYLYILIRRRLYT